MGRYVRRHRDGPYAHRDAEEGPSVVMAAASTNDVDLFVIGAGSGGVRAARIAAAHGARVMIAEEYRIGGTCVIRGCIPKKLLVYASRFAHEFAEAAGLGWAVPPGAIGLATLVGHEGKEN